MGCYISHIVIDLAICELFDNYTDDVMTFLQPDQIICKMCCHISKQFKIQLHKISHKMTKTNAVCEEYLRLNVCQPRKIMVLSEI